MSTITVHNITDSKIIDTDPQVLTVCGVKVYPGSFAIVNKAELNQKHYDLHGVCLWFGDKHPALKAKKQDPAGMSELQIKNKLLAMSKEDLVSLNDYIQPSFNLDVTTPVSRIRTCMLKACTEDLYILDPKVFYWLGKWKLLSNGDYAEL